MKVLVAFLVVVSANVALQGVGEAASRAGMTYMQYSAPQQLSFDTVSLESWYPQRKLLLCCAYHQLVGAQIVPGVMNLRGGALIFKLRKKELKSYYKQMMSFAAAGKAIELRRIHDKRFGTELTDKEGWTPIHWAAVNDHSAAIDALCERGANVGAIDKNGATALHWAAVNGSGNAIENLLNRGLKLTAKDKVGSSSSFFLP
eukprot:746152-Hanusia_phi.AAC.9